MIVRSQITGIVLLSTGAVIHGVYYQYQHFLDNSFLSVPSLLMAVGSIIFIIAFFGCCGAARTNYCMIITVRQALVKSALIVCFFYLKYIHLDVSSSGKYRILHASVKLYSIVKSSFLPDACRVKNASRVFLGENDALLCGVHFVISAFIVASTSRL